MIAEEDIKELIKIATHSNDEVGELLSKLLNIYDNRFYISDRLIEAIEEELIGHLLWFRENTKWIEKEENYTQKVIYLERIY